MMDFRAPLAAAALALSMAAPALSEQAVPEPNPAASERISASPAARRLVELLEAVNGGDTQGVRAYVGANGLEESTPPGLWGRPLPLVGKLLDLQRRSQGLDLVQLVSSEEEAAVAVVRNRLTGDVQGLTVRIEAEAPHRITDISGAPSSIVAPFAQAADPALPEEERLGQLGAYLERLDEADVFSGVVMIARDGEPVFSGAYGYADREQRIPNAIDTPFILGSMNKLFTSLAIGQLVEQGKLSYDDPLSKYVPDFPDAESAKRIRIKHLLSHTSGLGGYFNPDFFASLDRMRTVQDILDVADRSPPEFEPGTKWAYSNTGFQLLGRVIEVASGEDYFDYMRRNVFEPAGMTGTGFPHYDRGPVRMAQPYEIEYDGSRLHYANLAAVSPRRGGPAGGGLAAAPDLLRLRNALKAGRIVAPDTLSLHSSAKPELASPLYGFGFAVGARIANRPFVGHGGNAPGQCTEYGDLTDTPYTIIVLSNATVNTCMTVVGKILRLLPPTGTAT